MDYDEIHFANCRLRKLEAEQNEIYKKVKPYIKYSGETGSTRYSLIEDVAYWRKANQIHNWFVEILRNGIDEPLFTIEVTKDNLHDLYNLCLKTLSKNADPRETLPTRLGCYFGNLAYNDWYYREIYETKSLLEYLLRHFNFETHYLMYQCSW
ncbi:MAG: hypothetical protein ACXVNF_07630 [Neobacillus sp.]